jgi:hypothetical protein
MDKKDYLNQANDVMGDVVPERKKENQKKVWLVEANSMMDIEDIYKDNEPTK